MRAGEINRDISAPVLRPYPGEAGYLALFIMMSAIYFREGIFGAAVLAATGDGIQQFYPLQALVSGIYKSGELPLWNPYFFGGMPLMGAHQFGVLSPITAPLMFLFDTRMAFNLDLVIHYALSGYFAFLYIRKLTGSSLAALAGGAAAGYMGFLYLNPDHVSIVRTAPWLPCGLWLMERLRERPSPGRAAALGLGLSMLALSGHAQAAYYSTVLILAYAGYILAYAPGLGRRRFMVYLLMGGGLSIIIAMPQLIATAELASLALRQKLSLAEFSSGSFYPAKLPGLLFPSIFIKPFMYAPGVFTLLMGLGVAVRHIRVKGTPRFWIGAVAVAALLAFGEHTPLNALMYKVPGNNLFRVPSRLWFIVHLGLSVLMAHGLAGMLRAEARRWYALWMLGALGALALGPLWLRPFTAGAAREALGYTHAAVLWPLALMAMYTLGVLLIWRLPEKRAAAYAVIAIAALLIVEGFHYRPDIKRWDRFAKGLALERPVKYLEFLRDRSAGGRVALYTHSYKPLGVSISAPVMHRTRLLGGYDQLAPGAYASLLHMGRFGYIEDGFVEGLLRDNRLLSMLGARMVVVCDMMAEAYNKDPMDTESGPYHILWRTHEGRCGAYENTRALTRARPALRLVQAEGSTLPDEFDPASEALVDEGVLKELGRNTFSAGSVSIEAESANTVRLVTEFPGTGFVVLADQYYPGWKAYIDGEETTILRTNIVSRGVVVPRGRHEVLFAYRPGHIMGSLWLGGLAFLGCFVLIVREIKAKEKALS